MPSITKKEVNLKVIPSRFWNKRVMHILCRVFRHPVAMPTKKNPIQVIDLFCGIGGMTHWLVREWFDVKAGVDFMADCKFWYEANNNGAVFISRDIRDVSTSELFGLYDTKEWIKVLVGCPPCQPFSWMNTKKGDYFYNSEKANARSPLDKFAEFVEEWKPDIVAMENVANLINQKKYPAFGHFLETLRSNGYHVEFWVVNAKDYGVPQNRKRLILLASKLGEIHLIPPTHKEKPVTVREAIWFLPDVGIWEAHHSDPYHRSQNMSDLNKQRIEWIPKNGGNLIGAPEHLLPECHKKNTGKSYKYGVYARMRWEQPSPTLTTQCLWIGNGRYWHPEQNRAITVREAAIIQTFPKEYEFIEPSRLHMAGKMAKYIGNAVPVKLWEVIGESIKQHLKSIGR